MEVKQIYQLMNDVTGEILGNKDLFMEDLSNVVDMGEQIFSTTDVDNYVKTLINHIGKVVFVNRTYATNMPSMYRDGWEFGSVLEKISVGLLDAEENESWELENKASYDPNIFYKPSVSAKFYNSKVTFEIPVSFTELQVKQSFSSREQLNGFLSMIFNAVEKTLTVKMDSLVMRTMNNMIAETIHDAYPSADYTTKSSVKAVNLLYLYNQRFGTTLAKENCMTDAGFLRFASWVMLTYVDRLKMISTRFNIGGTDKFTPREKLHVVMLSDFYNGSKVYLQSDVYHEEMTKFPDADTVPYWQGSGDDYSFDDITTINVKTGNGNTVNVSGILGIMFDHDAMGVSNLDRRVTSNYNPKAEFYSNWHKFDAGYWNDTNENAVVFFVA